MAGEPVSRILSAAPRDRSRTATRRPFLWAAHCCATPAAYPRVDDPAPDRSGAGRALRRAVKAPLRVRGPDQPSPPIWPCSARGLPCPRRHHRGGGLLPHRFTLTERLPRLESGARFCLSLLTGGKRRRSALCCTIRSRALTRSAPWCYQARRPVESGLSSTQVSRVFGTVPGQRPSGSPASSSITRGPVGATRSCRA